MINRDKPGLGESPWVFFVPLAGIFREKLGDMMINHEILEASPKFLDKSQQKDRLGSNETKRDRMVDLSCI